MGAEGAPSKTALFLDFAFIFQILLYYLWLLPGARRKEVLSAWH